VLQVPLRIGAQSEYWQVVRGLDELMQELESRTYRPLPVRRVWGSSIVAISWPVDAEKICATPAGKGGVGPQLNLSSEDRTRANTIYDRFALAIAAYEGSTEVNAFSFKFDAYPAGTAMLTPQEQHGYELVPRRVQGLGPVTAV